jgi:hypothetical protein
MWKKSFHHATYRQITYLTFSCFSSAAINCDWLEKKLPLKSTYSFHRILASIRRLMDFRVDAKKKKCRGRFENEVLRVVAIVGGVCRLGWLWGKTKWVRWDPKMIEEEGDDKITKNTRVNKKIKRPSCCHVSSWSLRDSFFRYIKHFPYINCSMNLKNEFNL